MNNKSTKLRYSATWIIILLSILSIWEFSYVYSNSIKYLISGPRAIIFYLTDNLMSLIVDFSVTFFESITGLFIAIVSSLIISVVFCLYPFLIQFLYPALVITQVIPLVALAPLIILVFGTSITGKIAMAVIMCFFPILVSSLTGIRSISQNIIDLMYMYSASRWQMIRYVYFPLSTQHIISGIKISATLSVVGSIIAEFNGADRGLGKNIFIAAKRLEPELMMSSLILSAIMGCLLYFTTVLIERKIGHWYLQKNLKHDSNI